jgi:transcriptional regulator with XRE-family HTH domain
MTQLSFGQKLRNIRHEKGLSLKQAADLIGIDFTTLSKIEKEERYPQINSIEAYANAYEVDYKELQIHYLTERILKQLDNVDFALESLEESIRTIKNTINGKT